MSQPLLFNTETLVLSHTPYAPGAVELYGDLKIVRRDYTRPSDDKVFPALRIWQRSKKSPIVNTYFPYNWYSAGELARERSITDAKNADDRHRATVAERKADAQNATNDWKVGDLLKNSWGYDQTNVDFYEVVAVTAKTVTIRAIGGTYAEGNHSAVVPSPGAFLNDELLVKRVMSRDYLKMPYGVAKRVVAGSEHYVTPPNAGH